MFTCLKASYYSRSAELPISIILHFTSFPSTFSITIKVSSYGSLTPSRSVWSKVMASTYYLGFFCTNSVAMTIRLYFFFPFFMVLPAALPPTIILITLASQLSLSLSEFLSSLLSSLWPSSLRSPLYRLFLYSLLQSLDWSLLLVFFINLLNLLF